MIRYKVWIEIEKLEDGDPVDDYDAGLPFSSTATFKRELDAIVYAKKLHDISEIIKPK